MEVDYKRDMNHSYLILKEERLQNTTSYQIRMLVGNSIPSLLPCTIKGMNGEMLFYYDITSRQSVSAFYERQNMGWEDLKMILEGMVQALSQIGEFLLSPDDLVIQPDYMYLDLDSQKLWLCYLPGYQQDFQEQFRSFSQYFLPKIEHKDAQAVTLGYGIYRLAMEEAFQIDKVKGELYHSKESKEEERRCDREEGKIPAFEAFQQKKEEENRRREAMNAFFQEEEPEEGSGWKAWAAVGAFGIVAIALIGGAVYLEYVSLVVAGILTAALLVSGIVWVIVRKWEDRRSLHEEKANLEERACPEGLEKNLWEDYQEEYQEEYQRQCTLRQEEKTKGSETTVLYQAEQGAAPSLVSKVPGQYPTIFLEKEMVVVGKLPMAADVILETPTISRVHARICKKGEAYYLTDLNSRNGTCVNGRILQGEEEYRLQNYDNVSFAEIQYIFME